MRIRTAHRDDAARIAELSDQFGYSATASDMRSRLEIVLGSPDHLVLAAESDSGQIIGWLHATVSRPLVDEPTCHIAALVVDKKRRRSGVARALMQDAEGWAAHCGLKSVSLRSNIVRDAAHTFYERLGYERVKTQHAYRKRLAFQATRSE